MKKGFKPIHNNSAKILILGTFPSEKSLKEKEYYADGRNKFWEILFKVFHETPSSIYEEKKSLLLNNKLALWDVLGSCERDGSSDSKIKNEKPNNLKQFINHHENIRYVFVNSDGALSYYIKYIGFHPKLSVWKLPSPSGANYAHYSLLDKIKQWRAVIYEALSPYGP